MPTVVNDFACVDLALVADTYLSGLQITRVLDRTIAAWGVPGAIVSDIDTQLTSMVILM